jgi:class 3 adenylate cyclase
MARLTAGERAKLPDRAFAYVDTAGERRLPIYDEPHVRAALAPFNQVRFESDSARAHARSKLLAAAKKHRIVPVGFIDRELRVERSRAVDEPSLPSGFVTLLMSDIESSTRLLAELGDRYADLLDAVRDCHATAVAAAGGITVEARADEYFAVFACPDHAIRAAVRVQRDLATVADGVRVRMGIHAGYPTRRSGNYVGMDVHTVARVSDAAHGGQVLVSDAAVLALCDPLPDGVALAPVRAVELRGIPGPPTVLHQLRAPGLAIDFPPPRT